MRISDGSSDVCSSDLDMLGQVVGLAELLDEVELALEPVGVLLLVDEDRLEQLAGAVVARCGGGGDPVVEAREGLALELEVEPELPGGGLAPPHERKRGVEGKGESGRVNRGGRR